MSQAHQCELAAPAAATLPSVIAGVAAGADAALVARGARIDARRRIHDDGGGVRRHENGTQLRIDGNLCGSIKELIVKMLNPKCTLENAAATFV